MCAKSKRKLHKPEVVIAEIKRVWMDGMSSRDIAAAMNKELVTLQHDSIVKFFRQWEKELEPCYLPTSPRGRKVRTRLDPPRQETYVTEKGITLRKVFQDKP